MLDWLRKHPRRDQPNEPRLKAKPGGVVFDLRHIGTWLLLLGISLAGLHLVMLAHQDQPEQFNTNLLFWAAVIYLLWEKRQSLYLESGLFASCLGATLIAFVLFRTYSPAGYHLVVSPLLCGIGVGLLASGTKHLLDYWRELVVLSLPIVSQVSYFILQMISLPIMTAKFANYLLWLFGFEVQRQGVFINLPTGTVEIYEACSGVSSILQMLNLSVVFFLLFPTSLLQKISCIVVAILIGFISNGMRVAIMALLVAFSNRDAFDYWHGGQGSMVFSVIATLMLISFLWLAFLRQPAPALPHDQSN
jgi:cyanoexosortase A